MFRFFKKGKTKVSINRLALLITGMEHSGTTFLGNILNEKITNAKGAFECGLLLAKTPKQFKKHQPFYDWFCKRKEIGHWALTSKQRDEVTFSTSFDLAYEKLAQYYNGDGNIGIIDKTPTYCYQLEEILAKLDDNIPVIILKKEINSLYHSFKKRGIALDEFSKRYKLYAKGLKNAENRSNLLIIDHADIVIDQEKVLKRIQAEFTNLSFTENLSNSNINFALNPLKEDYSIETEKENALKALTAEEKETLLNLQSLLPDGI